MSPKPNKVKRYKNIYSNGQKKKRRLITATATILICAIVAFVGYSAYKPIVQFFNGEMTYSTAENSNASQYSQESSQLGVQNSSESNQNSSKDSLNSKEKYGKGVFVPTPIVKNDLEFSSFLKQAKDKGYTTIVLEAKDSAGAVQYQSAVPQVLEASSQAVDAYPLDARINEIKSLGMIPVVRLYAFEDNTASRVLEGSFVMYRGSTEVRWLDNSPEAGGRGWLSPESVVAQSYITALSEEISQMGCETLLMASVQYPTGIGTNLAYAGAQSDLSKMEVLKKYLTSLTKTLELNGTECFIEIPSIAFLQGDDIRYGGSPLDLGISTLAPEIFPSSLPSPLVIGQETITVPKDSPYDTTKLIYEEIEKALKGKGIHLLPIIQSYDGYENGMVLEQEKALNELGQENSFLYSSTGNYPSILGS